MKQNSQYFLNLLPETDMNLQKSIAPSFVTPLRYPGGKGRLGLWLSSTLRHNNIKDGCYVEPYAGGAGAALFLLKGKHVSRIKINDADPAIFAFWWAILNDTRKFISMIDSTAVNMENWQRARDCLLSHDENGDLTRLGFSAFFLNRTNRSGIIKGGVIGGKQQSGKYKIDARFNKATLIDRIQTIASCRNQIEVTNLDAMDVLDSCSSLDPSSTMLYLDPPYYNKSEQLYRNHYKIEDHKAIAAKVQSLEQPWIVTYDNCSTISDIYQNCEAIDLSFHYSTHTARPIGKEVMFYGNMSLPSPPTMRR